MLLVLMTVFAALGSVSPASAEQVPLFWQFDTEPPGTRPADFVVGTLFDGRPAGEWKILQSDRAKSQPQVLGQLQGTGAEHAYKVLLFSGAIGTDVDVQVSFLPIAGKADMGGGLIWRAADDRNYYLTRANPLEQNIRIYRVINGVRHMLNNFDQIIDVRHWHTLRIVNRGCRIEVFYDEKRVFDLCDEGLTQGQVGLWTKSDAITYFDDLRLQLLK
jgi:hypothetical protein